MEQKHVPLFTTRFSVGKRSFFFDVVKSEANTLRLVITTSEPGKGRWKREKITVEHPDIQEFAQSVTDSSQFMLNE